MGGGNRACSSRLARTSHLPLYPPPNYLYHGLLYLLARRNLNSPRGCMLARDRAACGMPSLDLPGS